MLVYESEPLTDDVTVAGAVSPRLWVSSSGTDSDFDVKLIDVYPVNLPDPDPNPTGVHLGGYQQLVRGEPFRAKFRRSFEKSGTAHAESAGGAEFFAAGHQPYFPARPPHQGADSEHVVSPDGSQSAKISEYSRRQAGRFSKSHGARLSRRRAKLQHCLAGDQLSASTPPPVCKLAGLGFCNLGRTCS